MHSRGAATAIMRICDCSKESFFLDPEISNYLGQMLERAYMENLVTPTALHDLRDGQEPTITVVLRAAVRANCTSAESLGRLFRKTSENALGAIHHHPRYSSRARLSGRFHCASIAESNARCRH